MVFISFISSPAGQHFAKSTMDSPNDPGARLNESEIGALYTLMEKSAVRIVMNNNLLTTTSGVVIDASGLILTARPLNVDKHNTCYTVYTSTGQKFRCYKFKEDNGLLLLRPQSAVKPLDLNFARLADDGPKYGSQIHCISHPEKLRFSWKSGWISYVNRPVSVIKREDPNMNASLLMDIDQCLNQTHGLCGDECAQGAPIFNNKGRIVGIYAVRSLNFDFLYNLESLKRITEPTFQSLDEGGGSCKEESKHAKRKVGDKGKRKLDERNK